METNTQNHSPVKLLIRRCNSIPTPTIPHPHEVGAGALADSYPPPLQLVADRKRADQRAV